MTAPLNDFDQLLLVLNPVSIIDDRNVVAIIRLARKYGVESLVRKCEHFLIKDSKKSTENLTKIADAYNLDLLKQFHEAPPLNQNLMECLECPVCHSTYNDIPRTLQCGHTFCNECLKHRAKCPICFKAFAPGSLILNYALQNVIEAVPTESSWGFSKVFEKLEWKTYAVCFLHLLPFVVMHILQKKLNSK